VDIGTPTGEGLVITKNQCLGQLAVKKSCTFQAALAPPTVGEVTGTLQIPYNGNVARVPVKGRGLEVKASAPRTVSFHATIASLPAVAKTISIVNRTAVPLSELSLIAPTSGSFLIDSATDTCANQTLPAKGKCTLTVLFSPPAGTQPGLVEDEFGYSYNYGANSGSVLMRLRGKVK